MADTTDLGADIILRDETGAENTYAAPAALRVDNTEGGTTDYINQHLIDKLPEVTEADNGKVFGVVDGAWQAMDAPSGGAAYTHPDTHPASMITGLAPAARAGSYDSLYGAPVGKRTVLPLGKYTIPDEDGKYWLALGRDEAPALGTVCTVIWGEDEYSCTAHAVEGDAALYIGNAALWTENAADDTDEPFVLMYSENNELAALVSAAQQYSIRCHIYIKDEVRKLDATLLPDGIATEDFVRETVAKAGDGSGDTTTMVEKEILTEQSFTTMFLEDAGLYCWDVDAPTEALVVGQEYTVRFDGVDYTCVSFDDSAIMADTVGLGNGAPMNLPGNGEPFAVQWTAGQNQIGVICFADTAATAHTISISTMVEVTAASGLPEFDLAAMGLPEVAAMGTVYRASCDTTAIMAALEEGPVKITLDALGTQVSGVMTAMKMDGAYQCGYVAVLEGLPCLFALSAAESVVAAQIIVLATGT